MKRFLKVKVLLGLVLAVFLLSTLIIGCSSDNGSSYIYPWNPVSSGTTENLTSSIYETESVGYAAGDNGTVLKTTNGGGSWARLTTGSNSNFKDIESEGQRVWVCGSNATLLSSVDGGATWVNIIPESHTGRTETLRSIAAQKYPQMWVCGDGGNILRTLDGGVTWAHMNSNTTVTLYRIMAFPNSNTVMAVGEAGTILISNDNGVTWNAQDAGINTDLYEMGGWRAPDGVRHSWVVGADGVIIKTDSVTGNWTRQTSNVTVGLHDVRFSNHTTGWVCGDNGTILYTEDAGVTWKKQNVGTNRNLKSVSFYQQNVKNGISCGDQGTILYTSSGGK